ncbi:transporter substrate-binding domain-containing protein [Nakamurella sp. YIM 132087]|uniref:Transporter substrate-binding domain-containing protein n=1 Tax=Nakamurella alba TaxID=2665158 RepID=A0A7K1FH92_9ACTN|nr:transporter substrate-binding domain-containing protein [Nakamurella alba]MTD13485.1 transporter substrate-binding domain-containing protein [Nakamurella alba]
MRSVARSTRPGRPPIRLTAVVVAGLLVLGACGRAAVGATDTGAPAVTSAAQSPSAASSSVPAPSAGVDPGTASVVPTVPSAAGNVTVPLPECRSDRLPTRTAGVLTFATSSPTRDPWFGPDPADGTGLDGQIALEVAAALGYPASAVRWVVVPAAEATARSGEFDAAIDRFVIPDGAGGPATADYSSGYFALNVVVVARAGSAAAGVDSLAGLAALGTLGAPRAVANGLPAETGLTVDGFTDETGALSALDAGDVPAVVMDVDDALALDDPDLTVVGALPDTGTTQSRQFGFLLAPGSPLTPCLSAAIDLLRVEGTLDAVADRWVRIPELS